MTCARTVGALDRRVKQQAPPPTCLRLRGRIRAGLGQCAVRELLRSASTEGAACNIGVGARGTAIAKREQRYAHRRERQDDSAESKVVGTGMMLREVPLEAVIVGADAPEPASAE